MKAQIINLIIFTFGIFCSVACEQVPPLSNSERLGADTTLIGPAWQLVAFVKADGDHIAIDRSNGNIPEHAYTLKFTKRPVRECFALEKYAHGTWCIELTGYPNTSPSTTYDLNPDIDQSLTIYFRGTTYVGRPAGSKEDEFFAALDAVTSYRINGFQLRLFYGEGQKALLFEPLDSSK